MTEGLGALHAGASSSALPASVVLVVLAAAVIHAGWNSIAHAIKDQLVAFTLIGIGGALTAVPLVLYSPLPHPSSWPYLAASVALHIIYNLLLMRCYRIGEFSQVYPLARGTSPLVVTVLAALLVGEVPGPNQVAGILAISTGLASLAFLGRHFSDADRPAILAALATGLTIAAYSTVDAIGVRQSGASFGYTGWLILFEGSSVPLMAVTRRRRALLEQIRPVWAVGLASGMLSLLAYSLVLWAQTQGSIAPVAALRESSIIFGALIGTLFFHERFGRPRVLATILVVAGILLLNAG